MVASYTPVSVSGYNSSAPVDNGTVTESNRITWAGIKTKLGDPLKTALDTIDDNVAAAVTTITTNLSTANSTLTTVNNSYATVVANLYAPSGTVSVFKQTSAPTGWTKGATHNDKALRLVSGAASTGGSTAFTSVFTSRTIVTGNLPAHTHTWAQTPSVSLFSNGVSDNAWVTSLDISGEDMEAGGTDVMDDYTRSTDTFSATGSVSGTSGSTGSGAAMDFAVRYVDVILATKD